MVLVYRAVRARIILYYNCHDYYYCMSWQKIER